MKLQYISGSKDCLHFTPVAVCPKNVIGTCWIDPSDVYSEPELEDHATIVSLSNPMCIGLSKDGKARLTKELLVMGKFEEISAGLGLFPTDSK